VGSAPALCLDPCRLVVVVNEVVEEGRRDRVDQVPDNGASAGADEASG